ncbi:hypothetical protein CYMTET_42596 [Cymbomonas tetramitiformis]|uniref:Crossover junction endonuclease MUS81 n=1 Tax=Cymbomonas tetramitiformis TaxID=36881 RepID=A0AAE0C5T4_9CHLO|nr:hypothetical protein CYMTET_42596 [Cymbomonas tetramitiformis]
MFYYLYFFLRDYTVDNSISPPSATRCELLVDTRESDTLLNALRDNSVPFTRRLLHTGDFHITREGRLLLTIERKTWTDLESSCIDGRFRDQLLRACAAAADAKAAHVLLVEHATVPSDARLRARIGSGSRERGGRNKGIMAWSAAHRCSVMMGVPVLRTADIADTVSLLAWLLRKADEERFACDLATSDAQSEANSHARALRSMDNGRRGYYGGTIHAKKSQNTDNPRACWTNMLTVIRGVSEQMSRAITETYGSPFELLVSGLADIPDASKESIRDKIAINLCDVDIASNKSRKRRRVGPTVAERLAKCLVP